MGFPVIARARIVLAERAEVKRELAESECQVELGGGDAAGGFGFEPLAFGGAPAGFGLEPPAFGSAVPGFASSVPAFGAAPGFASAPPAFGEVVPGVPEWLDPPRAPFALVPVSPGELAAARRTLAREASSRVGGSSSVSREARLMTDGSSRKRT